MGAGTSSDGLLTHGSQVENDGETACVRAALDAGITSFDTADVYANTVAESVLGEALKASAASRWRSRHGLTIGLLRQQTWASMQNAPDTRP